MSFCNCIETLTSFDLHKAIDVEKAIIEEIGEEKLFYAKRFIHERNQESQLIKIINFKKAGINGFDENGDIYTGSDIKKKLYTYLIVFEKLSVKNNILSKININYVLS